MAENTTTTGSMERHALFAPKFKLIRTPCAPVLPVSSLSQNENASTAGVMKKASLAPIVLDQPLSSDKESKENISSNTTSGESKKQIAVNVIDADKARAAAALAVAAAANKAQKSVPVQSQNSSVATMAPQRAHGFPGGLKLPRTPRFAPTASVPQPPAAVTTSANAQTAPVVATATTETTGKDVHTPQTMEEAQGTTQQPSAVSTQRMVRFADEQPQTNGCAAVPSPKHAQVVQPAPFVQPVQAQAQAQPQPAPVATVQAQPGAPEAVLAPKPVPVPQASTALSRQQDQPAPQLEPLLKAQQQQQAAAVQQERSTTASEVTKQTEESVLTTEADILAAAESRALALWAQADRRSVAAAELRRQVNVLDAEEAALRARAARAEGEAGLLRARLIGNVAVEAGMEADLVDKASGPLVATGAPVPSGAALAQAAAALPMCIGVPATSMPVQVQYNNANTFTAAEAADHPQKLSGVQVAPAPEMSAPPAVQVQAPQAQAQVQAPQPQVQAPQPQVQAPQPQVQVQAPQPQPQPSLQPVNFERLAASTLELLRSNSNNSVDESLANATPASSNPSPLPRVALRFSSEKKVMETAPSAASPVEDSPGASAQRGIASVIARRESFGRSGASLAMPTEAAMTLDDATRDADTCAEMPSTPGYGCLADPSLAFIDSELSRCAPMQRLRGHSDFVVSVEPFNSDSSLFTAALDDCVRVWRPVMADRENGGPWQCASVRIAPDSLTCARLGGYGDFAGDTLTCAVSTLSGGCYVLDALDASRPAMMLPSARPETTAAAPLLTVDCFGPLVAAAGAEGAGVTVWDVRAPNRAAAFAPLQGRGSVRDARICPGGMRVALATEEGAELLDLRAASGQAAMGGSLSLRLQGVPAGGTGSVRWSRGGAEVWACDAMGCLHRWSSSGAGDANLRALASSAASNAVEDCAPHACDFDVLDVALPHGGGLRGISGFGASIAVGDAANGAPIMSFDGSAPLSGDSPPPIDGAEEQSRDILRVCWLGERAGAGVGAVDAPMFACGDTHGDVTLWGTAI
ncbi:hypothetical protein PPROV_000613400 [Pycnococcus provasolii]|uniref:Uncharacterized protein n=1 Tax=Pycnococcus provasolii TaxID=41880 RepID=A0A830HKI8_9CHLO|nr:hypothetical protein PPROV_000613400 [Pycnococcus provasolii]